MARDSPTTNTKGLLTRLGQFGSCCYRGRLRKTNLSNQNALYNTKVLPSGNSFSANSSLTLVNDATHGKVACGTDQKAICTTESAIRSHLIKISAELQTARTEVLIVEQEDGDHVKAFVEETQKVVLGKEGFIFTLQCSKEYRLEEFDTLEGAKRIGSVSAV